MAGYGEYQLQLEQGSDKTYPVPNRAVDIYLNKWVEIQLVIWESLSDEMPARQTLPFHMIQNASQWLPPAVGGYGEIPNESYPNEFHATLLLPSLLSMVSFDTQYQMESRDRWHTPFDHYHFTASAFAIEKATNKSIPLAIFAVNDTGPGDFSDFTASSETVPTKSNFFTYNATGAPTTIMVESNTTYVTVKHSIRARVLTLSMFAINWVLTLCSVAIALTVVIKEESMDGFAYLPVTIILSIPAVRILYIGSPPFGIHLGKHRNYAAPLPPIDTPVRHGRVLPTNADSGGVHHSGIGAFRGEWQRECTQEMGGLTENPPAPTILQYIVSVSFCCPSAP